MSGIENWSKRAGGSNKEYPWVVLERFWIVRFIRELVTPSVQAGSNCLEWGNPETPGSGFSYTKLVPGCTYEWDIQFDHTYYLGKPMSVVGNVVYSDVLNLPYVLGALKMNVIFATQVFEHLADPLKSAAALFEATAPSGLVVFTAPQQAQFHKVPHDYFRYTVEGAKYVFVSAGFCVPNYGFAGGGDFVFDIARDAGLLVQDFPVEEVEGGYQRGYEKVSHSAIGVHMLAYKPPHPSCDDPTAGWDELNRQGIRAYGETPRKPPEGPPSKVFSAAVENAP
jgi:hypothetical protein